MGSEAIVTGRNIISDMAQNTDPNTKICDIVRRNMSESTHRLIQKLSSQGHKRNRATSTERGGKAEKARKQPGRGKNKKANVKRDMFS